MWKDKTQLVRKESDMVNDLTLKEKIGQMMMVGLDGNTIDTRIKNLIMNYKIGGVILYRKNFATYQDMLKLITVKC